MVEVRITGMNKGTMADAVLSKANESGPVDFVLCIGAADEDEYMRAATTARAGAPEMRERLQHRLFTATVGHKAVSHAQYLLDDSRDVLRLLETLRNADL